MNSSVKVVKMPICINLSYSVYNINVYYNCFIDGVGLKKGIVSGLPNLAVLLSCGFGGFGEFYF